jgi:hypothetical protein
VGGDGVGVLLGASVAAGVAVAAGVGVATDRTTSTTSQPVVPLSPRTLRQVRPSTSRSGPAIVNRVPSGTVWRMRPVVPGSARRLAPCPPVPNTSTRSGAAGSGVAVVGVAVATIVVPGVAVDGVPPPELDVDTGVAGLVGVAVGVGNARSAVETIQPTSSPS